MINVNGIKKIGKIKTKTASEIKKSPIGIGFEKLDRNLYDPERCYDFLAKLGAKWVRIQSGWCRTEKEKGVYDFSWLDSIVDNLTERGLKPWLCLCYGNELYTPNAVNAAGAVGCPPIKTAAEREAWAAYVKKCAEHFKDRIELFEVWNEPDGDYCWRPASNPEEYREFCILTSKAVKEVIPNAKIAAGSLFYLHSHINYLYRMMNNELADCIDFITYHGYNCRPETDGRRDFENIKAVIDMYGGKIGIIQGEAGTQSRYSLNGGFSSIEWTSEKQTKFILRRLLSDLADGVYFSSIFSLVDIYENIFTDDVDICRDKYGFFGIVGESFDENGKPLSEYREKEAFYAMQTVSMLFSDGVEKTDMAVTFDLPETCIAPEIGVVYENPADSNIACGAFKAANGSKAFVYWKAVNIITQSYDGLVKLNFYGVSDKFKLIDLYDGTIYKIDDENVIYENGVLTLKKAPLKDYPLMIAFDDFEE